MAKIKKNNSTDQIFTKDSLDFLRSYINNSSPTGFEVSGQKLWLNYIKSYVDEYITDPYGSVAAVINKEAQFKVVIEAHADEISWFVHYISDDGLIYVARNGGSDHQVAPAMRVWIHGKKGAVKAVFGWPAIHTRLHSADKKEPIPTVNNIFLDCGARSKKEVEELGIAIGSVVTYQDGFDELANGNIIGRAFDNRIGGFIIAQVARLLKENNDKLPFGLYIVNAVQEEIGLRGAEMMARRIQPNVAIVTDVTHDTQTPFIDKKIEGDIMCGRGPVLAYAPAVQVKLLHFVEDIAKQKDIAIQMRALSRVTGTDTDSFAYSNDGCPSVLISMPLRYMHTPVEMIHKEDVAATVKLIYHTLLSLSPKTDLDYFH